jgi:hypothetical protein
MIDPDGLEKIEQCPKAVVRWHPPSYVAVGLMSTHPTGLIMFDLSSINTG